MRGTAVTHCARRHHVLVLGTLLSAGCASAPSGNPADEPVTPSSAPGIVNVDITLSGLKVLNIREFLQTLMREMPPEMVRAGVDGYAKVWLHVDVRGRVLDRKIHTTSGNGMLDRVILRSARVVRFSPEGRSDPIWIAIRLGYRRR